MTRKKILLTVVSALLVITAGAGWMIKIYFAEAAQKLISEMTDTGVVMEDVEFHYNPLPSLYVKNMQIVDGNRNVKIPLLKVYPDLGELVKGNIRLHQLVVQNPIITSPAGYSGDSSTFGSAYTLPAAFPQNIEIISGRLSLTGSGESEPLTISADLQNGGSDSVGMAFNVRSASIKELGFDFSGNIDLKSITPLKLGLRASTCSIDPADFLGFLTGFGYLGNSTIPELASAENFKTEDLDFQVDTVTGTMNFSAESLILDGSSGKGLKLNIARDGGFSLAISEAEISAGEFYSMAIKSDRGRNALQSICNSAHLKSITPEGSLVLKNVTLSSAGDSVTGGKGLNGRFTLSAKNLNLTLSSLDGRAQKLSISDLDADVEVRDGKPVVSVRKFSLASSEGGSMVAQASFPLPFEYRKARFSGAAKKLKIFGNVLTLNAEKKTPLITGFDLKYRNRKTSVASSGNLKLPYYGVDGVEAVLSSLHITSVSEKVSINENDSDQPFDFRPLLSKGLNGSAVIRSFAYNEWPFSNIHASLSSGSDRAVIKAKGLLFHLNLNADVVLSADQMAAQCSVKGRGASLPGLIACFAKDLSVYLTGNVFLDGNVFVQGTSINNLIDSIQGQGLLKINDLNVYRLSNLDERLGFLIDMLKIVSVSPGEKDSLAFNSAVLKASIAGKKVFFDSFTLRGPLLQAWGDGHYDMAQRRFILDGKVKSSVGTVNSLNIDRKFNS